MAESSDKTARFKLVAHTQKYKKAKEGVATEGTIQHAFIYPMRISIKIDDSGTKKPYTSTYNPIPKTKLLLMTMANVDPGLSLTSLDGKTTLLIKHDNFPKTEDAFKKYFTCDWEKATSKQKARVMLGCTINGNCTLNNLKHGTKPSTLLAWLNKEQVFVEADALGMGKTKTIGYLTGIHPRIINRTHAKEKLSDTLNTTYISNAEARKLDSTITETTDMEEDEEEPTIHCPVFELFQTTIGIGSTPRIETDVIGIKCQSGRAALLREFLLKSTGKIEQQGQGKFIPAGLANVIGTETMKNIIRQNNQYLKTITYIPINGIPKTTLNTEILVEDATTEGGKLKTTVYDYFLSAEWCRGLEPTDREGRYLLITTRQDLSEAREWLDDHLEPLYTDYIPQAQPFTPIEGYPFPTRGDKPRFSEQLGTYADHLRQLYPSANRNDTPTEPQWNKSPINKPRHYNRTLTYDNDEFPTLPKKQTPKRNQTGDQKPPETNHTPDQSININTMNANALRDRIMADIKEDLTKTFSHELTQLSTEITDKLTVMSTTITKDFNTQMAAVLATIDALNQRFTDVMERFPINTTTPAHKKTKGLGVAN